MRLLYEFVVLLFIFWMISWFFLHDLIIGLAIGSVVAAVIMLVVYSRHKHAIERSKTKEQHV